MNEVNKTVAQGGASSGKRVSSLISSKLPVVKGLIRNPNGTFRPTKNVIVEDAKPKVDLKTSLRT